MAHRSRPLNRPLLTNQTANPRIGLSPYSLIARLFATVVQAPPPKSSRSSSPSGVSPPKSFGISPGYSQVCTTFQDLNRFQTLRQLEVELVKISRCSSSSFVRRWSPRATNSIFAPLVSSHKHAALRTRNAATAPSQPTEKVTCAVIVNLRREGVIAGLSFLTPHLAPLREDARLVTEVWPTSAIVSARSSAK
jgi:hypothetical protein